jgi:nitrous oxidase accessory protein NosD
MGTLSLRASIAFVLGLALGSAASAAVLEVNDGAACPGTGTPAAPFCSIALAAAVAAPGDTVNVAPGDYREQVIVPTSGAPGLPILFRSAGPGARVLGTEDLSDPALWAPAGGTRWSTPFAPDTNTRQVFVDGARLTEAADLASLALNGFFFDAAADVLTVDLGGPNPGTRDVEAGARSFGFDVTGRSHVVVDGFQVSGHNTSGIRVRASANVAIRNNAVSNARSFGILAEGTAAPLVPTTDVELSGNEAFGNGDGGLRLRTGVSAASVLGNVSHHNLHHGLLVTETTDSRIAGNEFFRNARPGGVSTTGLLLDPGSRRIQVERNLARNNQDSGFQVSGGTLGGVLVRNQDVVLVRNISFGNGDHGFDNRESDRTLLVSNTAYGNVNDGFSVEGNAANVTLANNIGANNGGNDLFVSADSTSGFSANYDVWWNVGTIASPEIEFAGVAYQSVIDFRAATGHEQNGSSLDPRLANPGAGDFHPRAGGSAVDSANAAAPGFQALDFDGVAPFDLPGVANTGAGVPNFADRGALEAVDEAPTARLRVFPRRIFPGGVVLAEATGSRDDVRIVSYRFDWGDGSVDTHAFPFGAHRYDAPGVYHVRLTVTDSAGQTATAQQPVQVRTLRIKPTKAAKAPKRPKH